MNRRNWERLLIATLRRARDTMPGPGCTEGTIKAMKDSGVRSRARIGIDIDEVLCMADERAAEEDT